MRPTVRMVLASLVIVGCGQEVASDVTGSRAFEHEGQWFIATCEQLEDGVLGDDLGTVPFEDTSLELRRVNGVAQNSAVAIEWNECGSSWTLATAGQPGDAPDVEPFREVLR